MTTRTFFQIFIRAAGLITGLVVIQQLIAMSLFGIVFDWSAIPQLVLANLGVVALWLYIRDPDKKIPVFAAAIAAFFLAAWLRAVLIYLGVLRFVAPPIVAFLEKQLAAIVTVFSTPQFVPTAIAAVILLLLMPKVKAVYRRLISN
ncbi:MAG: hypothetical protein LBS91_06075 [Clostridiales Family XIII bacterium]|jgi:hypothetical protein|nr:hypothetical protein [Clostridiales Family XIII bacterium]